MARVQSADAGHGRQDNETRTPDRSELVSGPDVEFGSPHSVHCDGKIIGQMNPTPLLHRSAIITGANQGLGLAIAQAFVDAGAHVVVAARSEALLHEAARQLRSRARHDQVVFAIPADVSNRESCDRLVTEAARRLPDLS